MWNVYVADPATGDQYCVSLRALNSEEAGLLIKKLADLHLAFLLAPLNSPLPDSLANFVDECSALSIESPVKGL